jgi:hypothetical protein
MELQSSQGPDGLTFQAFREAFHHGDLEPLRTLVRRAQAEAHPTEGRCRWGEAHYTFVGATSQTRPRKEVAPAWADRCVAEEVDVCLLVAT